MTTEEKVEIVKQLIRENGNKFITVDFHIKDGSLRHMMVNRSKVLEASVKGTATEATAAHKDTLLRSAI